MNKKKVLILASGLSAKQLYEYPYKENNWTILTVNNGWLACEKDWDFWVRSNDYKGNIPIPIKSRQTVVTTYGPSLKRYGGQKECGYSITVNAAYWALDKLNPSVIGFLGADMNYKPDENGNTHIYGVGFDILKNNISDPDRMIKVHGNGNPEHLKDIYTRFETIASENGCKVYNFSHTIETRLPYERIYPSNLQNNKYKRNFS
jgi:hypothetical protein